MSRVSLTINNRQFQMKCEDGHEGYLINLAREVDNRISSLRSKSGEIGDNGAMVMLAITVADELSQAGQRISRLEEELIAVSDRHGDTSSFMPSSSARRRPEIFARHSQPFGYHSFSNPNHGTAIYVPCNRS
jgi:cell division protein ZapA (FtsZ GTPase activity inhibitor)